MSHRLLYFSQLSHNKMEHIILHTNDWLSLRTSEPNTRKAIALHQFIVCITKQIPSFFFKRWGLTTETIEMRLNTYPSVTKLGSNLWAYIVLMPVFYPSVASYFSTKTRRNGQQPISIISVDDNSLWTLQPINQRNSAN